MAQAGAERGDLVVAVGGGVVGDLAGFCAAVYQRGMRHVQVPTTLVAQVDSAYGGKTGVDLPEGKNYVGVYHQPSAVICDPAALETLPPAELCAGYAEVVKTALIAGGPLWARVRQGGEVDDETDPRLHPDEARGGGRGRARRRPPAGAEPGPHGRARDRGGHRLHALPPRRGRRASGCSWRCGCPARRRCATRWPSCWPRAGCRSRSAAPSPDEVLALVERDKKRSRRARAVRAGGGPRRGHPGHDVPAADLRAALEEVTRR